MSCKLKSPFFVFHFQLIQTRNSVGFSWTLLFAPYGSRFRDMRKAVHQVFNPDAVKNYREIELDAAHGFLRGLLRRPDDFMKAIPR